MPCRRSHRRMPWAHALVLLACAVSASGCNADREAGPHRSPVAAEQRGRAQALLAEVAGLKDSIQKGEADERALDAELRAKLLEIPNLPLDEVPTGADEHDNVPYFGRNGTEATAAAVRPAKPSFSFKPKEHFETGEALGEMDFEVAAKISGARFVVLLPAV